MIFFWVWLVGAVFVWPAAVKVMIDVGGLDVGDTSLEGVTDRTIAVVLGFLVAAIWPLTVFGWIVGKYTFSRTGG